MNGAIGFHAAGSAACTDNGASQKKFSTPPPSLRWKVLMTRGGGMGGWKQGAVLLRPCPTPLHRA